MSDQLTALQQQLSQLLGLDPQDLVITPAGLEIPAWDLLVIPCQHPKLALLTLASRELRQGQKYARQQITAQLRHVRVLATDLQDTWILAEPWLASDADFIQLTSFDPAAGSVAGWLQQFFAPTSAAQMFAAASPRRKSLNNLAEYCWRQARRQARAHTSAVKSVLRQLGAGLLDQPWQETLPVLICQVASHRLLGLDTVEPQELLASDFADQQVYTTCGAELLQWLLEAGAAGELLIHEICALVDLLDWAEQKQIFSLAAALQPERVVGVEAAADSGAVAGDLLVQQTVLHQPAIGAVGAVVAALLAQSAAAGLSPAEQAVVLNTKLHVVCATPTAAALCFLEFVQASRTLVGQAGVQLWFQLAQLPPELVSGSVSAGKFVLHLETSAHQPFGFASPGDLHFELTDLSSPAQFAALLRAMALAAQQNGFYVQDMLVASFLAPLGIVQPPAQVALLQDSYRTMCNLAQRELLPAYVYLCRQLALPAWLQQAEA